MFSEEDRISIEDDDVAEERARILNSPSEILVESETLILWEVVKYYGRFLAVDKVSVGIPRGECFGLLGVNGAGKTTIFKMLTGDESVSFGDALLDGYSVKLNINKVC